MPQLRMEPACQCQKLNKKLKAKFHKANACIIASAAQQVISKVDPALLLGLSIKNSCDHPVDVNRIQGLAARAFVKESQDSLEDQAGRCKHILSRTKNKTKCHQCNATTHCNCESSQPGTHAMACVSMASFTETVKTAHKTPKVEAASEGTEESKEDLLGQESEQGSINLMTFKESQQDDPSISRSFAKRPSDTCQTAAASSTWQG